MDIEANKTIGAALRRIRMEIPLTQSELARRLGKPQSFVSKIEMGERALQLCELPTYSKALGADPSQIVNRLFNAQIEAGPRNDPPA